MKEKLSALIDGELDETESSKLIQAIQDDPKLMAIWERYHLARAVLQGEISQAPANDFASKVAEKVADTPTVLAPIRIKHGRQLNRATRIVGNLAIAASIAAIAIIGLRSFITSSENETGLNAENDHQPAVVRVVGTRWDTNKVSTEHELNMYLVGHTEYTPAASMQGLISYVHVVAYDTNQ